MAIFIKVTTMTYNMYLRKSNSIEKCSISASNITDKELTSFFIKLNLTLCLVEKQRKPNKYRRISALKDDSTYKSSTKTKMTTNESQLRKHCSCETFVSLDIFPFANAVLLLKYFLFYGETICGNTCVSFSSLSGTISTCSPLCNGQLKILEMN